MERLSRRTHPPRSCSRRWSSCLARIAAIAGVLVASGVLQSPAANADLIIGAGSKILANAREAGGPTDQDTKALDSIPSGSISATRGANHSSGTYSVDGSGFSMTFDHTRSELQTSSPVVNGVNTTAELLFTVDTPGQYVLDGVFDFVDPVGKRAYLQVFLSDQTSGSLLYNKFDENQSATNESFRVDANFTGALIGNLVPGNDYRLWVQAVSSDMLSSTPSTSTGSGYFNFLVVPEPGTGLLVLVGLASLARRRRPLCG